MRLPGTIQRLHPQFRDPMRVAEDRCESSGMASPRAGRELQQGLPATF